MKRVIKNESRIRLTANGNSVVEGSFAKVSAIEGKSVSVGGTIYHSSIKGIYSQNRNFVPVDKAILNSEYGLVNLTEDFIDLLNNQNIDTICIKQNFTLKYIISYQDLRLELVLVDINGNSHKIEKRVDIKRDETKERTIIYKIDKNYTYKSGFVRFNQSDGMIYTVVAEPYISSNNQIEIGYQPTRFTNQRTSQLDFPKDIILRSTIDGSVRDIYFPEFGLITRRVDENLNVLNFPKAEDEKDGVNKISFSGYQVFNNGYEKILSNDETALKNGAIPTIYTTYIQEERQGADNSRFDFFMIDGESFSGIGYEQLKTTNQLTYVSSPSRQNDGSMQNIEDYESFVIGASDIGFSLIHPDTYVRLKEKLCSKRTFEVSYYDKDFDKFITKEMYVKPIDLDNFLSLGDSIIGMKNFTISFVPTLNEEIEYTATFYTSANQQYGEELKEKFGRAITTPELPSGYNYWLIKESGFNSGNFHTIKGNKKLNLFGDTKLVAIK